MGTTSQFTLFCRVDCCELHSFPGTFLVCYEALQLMCAHWAAKTSSRSIYHTISTHHDPPPRLPPHPTPLTPPKQIIESCGGAVTRSSPVLGHANMLALGVASTWPVVIMGTGGMLNSIKIPWHEISKESVERRRWRYFVCWGLYFWGVKHSISKSASPSMPQCNVHCVPKCLLCVLNPPRGPCLKSADLSDKNFSKEFVPEGRDGDPHSSIVLGKFWSRFWGPQRRKTMGHWGQTTLRTRLWGQTTLRTGDFEDSATLATKYLKKFSTTLRPKGAQKTLQLTYIFQMLAAYIQ